MKLFAFSLAVIVAALFMFVSVRADSSMVLKSTGLVADFPQTLPAPLLYPNANATNVTSSFTMTFSDVEEVDNNTKLVFRVPLDKTLNWAFGDPFVKKDENGSVIYTAVNLTAAFNVKSTLTRMHFVWYMYQKDGVVPHPSENVTVYANSLKWAMFVEGWPFADTFNSLQFAVQMSHHDSKANTTHSEFTLATNTSAGNPSILHLPGSDDKELRVELSNVAVHDGHVHSLVNFVKNESTVLFRFGSFTHFMMYDPVARITESEGGNNILLYVIIGVVVAVVLAAIAVIAIIGFAVYKLVIEKKSVTYQRV